MDAALRIALVFLLSGNVGCGLLFGLAIKETEIKTPIDTSAPLRITTDPTGAKVSIDGKSMGTTPVDVVLPYTVTRTQTAKSRCGAATGGTIVDFVLGAGIAIGGGVLLATASYQDEPWSDEVHTDEDQQIVGAVVMGTGALALAFGIFGAVKAYNCNNFRSRVADLPNVREMEIAVRYRDWEPVTLKIKVPGVQPSLHFNNFIKHRFAEVIGKPPDRCLRHAECPGELFCRMGRCVTLADARAVAPPMPSRLRTVAAVPWVNATLRAVDQISKRPYRITARVVVEGLAGPELWVAIDSVETLGPESVGPVALDFGEVFHAAAGAGVMLRALILSLGHEMVVRIPWSALAKLYMDPDEGLNRLPTAIQRL